MATSAADWTASAVGMAVAVMATAAADWTAAAVVMGAVAMATAAADWTPVAEMATAGSETDAHRSHGSRCPYRKRCTLILVRRHRSHHQMNMRTSPCTGRLAMVGTATAAEVWRWEPKSGQRRETMWGL